MMRKTIYLRSLFINLFISILIFISCRNSQQKIPTEISDIIIQTKQQFCPDRRLAVFDIEANYDEGKWVLIGEVDNPEAKRVLARKIQKIRPDGSIVLKISVLPDSSVGDNKWGLIRVSVGNVRAKPGYSSELVNQVMMGTFIQILQKKGGWYYSRVTDGYLGWINGAFFEKMTLQEKQAWENGQHLVYRQLTGKIYEKPDTRSQIKSDVVGGNILKVISNGPRWSIVKWANDQMGYVRTKDCIKLNRWQNLESVSVKKLLNTAYQFKGLPYLWGGNSPKGVDCSGFTQIVFKWNGIDLLRDASQQFRQGKAVNVGEDFDELRPGDLLFFGPRENKITHVAIYIGGKKYIHSSGYVKINSLDSTATDFSRYRLEQFQSARRLIN